MIGDRIKERRQQLNMSQEELALKVGYKSRSSIAKIEKNERDLPQTTAILIAKALGVSIEYLLNEDELDKIPTLENVPLYDDISCGKGLWIEGIPIDYIAIPQSYCNPHSKYFANIAKGDSMLGKGIKEGDVLVFEQTNVLDNGQIGSFCLNDKNYCKIFRRLNNGIILLESANEKYDPIIIDIANDDACFRIIGRYKFKFSKEQ